LTSLILPFATMRHAPSLLNCLCGLAITVREACVHCRGGYAHHGDLQSELTPLYNDRRGAFSVREACDKSKGGIVTLETPTLNVTPATVIALVRSLSRRSALTRVCSLS
jgi:hypothetical protein